MLNFPSRVETVAVKCGDPVDRPSKEISDTRAYYDSGAFGAAPSKGDVTKTEKIADCTGDTPVYVTDAISTLRCGGRWLQGRVPRAHRGDLGGHASAECPAAYVGVRAGTRLID